MRNWIGGENFGFCFCITLTFIYGSENEHQVVFLLKLEVSLIFPDFLIPESLNLFGKSWAKWHTKVSVLDTSSHFTCGESSLY